MQGSEKEATFPRKTSLRQVSLPCPEPAPKSARVPELPVRASKLSRSARALAELAASYGSGGMAQTFSEGFGLQAGRCSIRAEVPEACAPRNRQDINTSRLAKSTDGSVVPRTPARLQLEPADFASTDAQGVAKLGPEQMRGEDERGRAQLVRF